MGERIRVLLVDEDPDVLELTETFLEREDEDIEVLTERSGSAALEVLEGEAVDCVVSDYRMPEMDGLELHEAVTDREPLPFFLFTASADRETTEAGEAAGVTGVVQKGAGTDHYARLAERIRAAVEAAE